jgi:Ca2+-dependent lipid-binding protein
VARTKTCDEAGKFPKWNEEFQFAILSTETDTVNLLCYDEDIIIDDFIGLATLNIANLSQNVSDWHAEWIDIFKKNKKTGEILIETKYEPVE